MCECVRVCVFDHRCTGEYLLGASESILRLTSIQDRQQTQSNCVEIIEYFMIYNLFNPDFDLFCFSNMKTWDKM